MSAPAAAPMQIVELRATNTKRLKAVTIRPDADGNLVVLSGRNGAGKTSVLDAIAMALGGREQIPAEPIRRGADHAEVVVDLGDLIVRRTFTAAGGGTLTVSNRDGARFQSPQTMLDALVGRLSFDPLAFSREDPKRQAETLRQLVGLDTAKLDARRAALYQERTATNRQVDAMRARADAMPKHGDAPAAPVSVAELSERLQAANRRNKEVEGFRANLKRAAVEVSAQAITVKDLREQLAAAERDLAKSEAILAALEASASEFVEVPTAPILQQLRDAEALNRKVRENEQRAAAEAAHADLRSVSDGLTAQIKDIDAQRAAAIASAKMPVPGLGFDAAGGVTLNGLPLEQASGAERLRVSVAIGLAMNPRLRVLLIRDASLLDRDGMRMVAEMAAEAGAQLWLERVEVGAETTVVIEDGEVVAPDPHELNV